MLLRASFAYVVFAVLLLCVLVACDRNVTRTRAEPYTTESKHKRATSWSDAKVKAQGFISRLSNVQKVSLITGLGGSTTRNCAYQTVAVSTFPGFCIADGPLGVRIAFDVTAFPAGVNAAQTWDRDMLYQRGLAMGQEFKGKGIHVALGPGLNMARVPEAGRNWEGFGADPYLAGEAAYQTVAGMQDGGVIACAKHLIGNEQEISRTSANSIIDDRTIHEIYGWPFMKAVQAGVASVMCAYNLVNGSFSCQNTRIQNQILRDEWGFKGFIISDWEAAHDRVPAATSGLDMAQPSAGPFANLANYIGQGVSQADLNRMATNVMTAYYKFEMDLSYPPVSIRYSADYGGTRNSPTVNVQGSHATLARQMAADSIVMLKNTAKGLPLSTTANLKIAVIGNGATTPTTLVRSAGDGLFSDGTLIMGWGSGTAFAPYIVAPYDAISRAYGGAARVTLSKNNFDLAAARTAARAADVAIVFVSANSGEGYVKFDDNPGDRKNLTLWGNGDNLINTVAAVNSRTIVVMHIVGQVDMPWANHVNISSILLAGLPGQETGNSLVDVISGGVNPSGRLVYTIATSTSHYNADIVTGQSPTVTYTEKLNIDYRNFDTNNIAPRYEFGYGLSYTTFVYSNLVINGNPQPGNTGDDTTEVVNIRVTVQNTGSVVGKEVAQLYIGYPTALGEPPKVLKGFDKKLIAAGSSSVFTFSLTALDISWWDVVQQKWQLSAGTYTAYVGASSRDIRQTGVFYVGGIPTSTTSNLHASTTAALNAVVASTAIYASSTTALNSATTSASLEATTVAAAQVAATTSQNSASTFFNSASTSANSVSTSNAAFIGSTTAAIAFTTSTASAAAPKPIRLWSKVGLAWSDGDSSNIWAVAGNGWNRVSWLYTYGPWGVPAADVADLEFVPMLSGCHSIADFESAKSLGLINKASAVLSFWEPDANELDERTAVGVWREHLQPLRSDGINLGAPLVSPTAQGKNWLSLFMQICQGCSVSFIPVHWFGGTCTGLQLYLLDMYTTFKKPLWVLEWACVSDNKDECSSDLNVSLFVKCTTSWMDSQSWVQRYAHYGARRDLGHVNRTNSLLTEDGFGNTQLGVQYAQDLHG